MKRSTSTPIRWNFTGDKVRAQQLTGQARKLLGGVEARKGRREGGFGYRAVTLAGGETVNITSLRGITNITINVPIVVKGLWELVVVPYDYAEAPDGWGEPFNEANPRGTPGGLHPEVIVNTATGQVKRRPQWAEEYPEGLFYGTWGSYTDGKDLYSWGDPGATKAGSGRWSFKNGNKHVLFDSEIADGFTGYREIVFVSDTVVVVGGVNGGLVQFYTYTYSGDGSVVQTDDHLLSTTLYDDALFIQRRNTSEFYLLDTNEDPLEVQFPRLLDLAPEELTEESIEIPTALYTDEPWSDTFVAEHTVANVPVIWSAENGYENWDVLVNMNHQTSLLSEHYAAGEVFVWVDRGGNPLIQTMIADKNWNVSSYKTYSLNPNHYLSEYYSSVFTLGNNSSGYTRISLDGKLVEEFVLSGVNRDFSHTAQHNGTVPGAPETLSVHWSASQPIVSGNYAGVGNYTAPGETSYAWGPPYIYWGIGFYYKLNGVLDYFPTYEILPLDFENFPEPHAYSGEEAVTISPPREWILMVYGRREELFFEGTYESDLETAENWLEPTYPGGILAFIDAPRLRDPGAV